MGPVPDAAFSEWMADVEPRLLLVHLLRDGSNLLAVEVHQTGAWDPDSSLAVRMVAGA